MLSMSLTGNIVCHFVYFINGSTVYQAIVIYTNDHFVREVYFREKEGHSRSFKRADNQL